MSAHRNGPPGVFGSRPAALKTLRQALRQALAKAQGQPAYVIFPDRTLLELATRRPANGEQLLPIHGIGRTKLERYGHAFLDVVLRHASA